MDTTEPGHEGGLTFKSKHNVGSFAMALHCSPPAMSYWLSADSSDNKDMQIWHIRMSNNKLQRIQTLCVEA